MDIAWERMPEEPDEAYKQFLVYLALGPERTLLMAYQVHGKGFGLQGAQEVPQAFKRTAQRWNWIERASAFNTHAFVTKGLNATFNYIMLIDKILKKLNDKVESDFDKITAKASLPQLMDALNVLAQFIPQQTVQSLLTNSASAGPARIVGPGEQEVRERPDPLRQGAAEDRLHLGRNGDGGEVDP